MEYATDFRGPRFSMPPAEDTVPEPVDVHRLLGNRRRLLVIRYLSLWGSTAQVDVRHLARVVRALETGVGPASVSTDEYESGYNSLIQNHLPKLAATGLIEYDDRGKAVTANDCISRYALVSILTHYLL